MMKELEEGLEDGVVVIPGLPQQRQMVSTWKVLIKLHIRYAKKNKNIEERQELKIQGKKWFYNHLIVSVS